MRPKLKIGPLTHLQDARSSAAVGFDLISFSLERGSNKKLAPAMVWNIINWIQGPEILLEINAKSLDELAEINKMFQAPWISFPLSDWNSEYLTEIQSNIYFRATIENSPQQTIQALAEVEALGYEAVVELSLEEIHTLESYKALSNKLYLHFTKIETLIEFLQSKTSLPLGFALGDEFRENAEYLDYEQIDELMEIFEDWFPED